MFIQVLIITFEAPEGDTLKEHTLSFESAPLGLRFRQDTMPMYLANVDDGSPAQTLGCKIGWKVKAINHRNVLGIEYRDALRRIKVGAMSLVLNNPKSSAGAAFRGSIGVSSKEQ